MIDKPGWDEYFLRIASVIADRGDCTRRKVGAVIVWQDRIWATGYNGTPHAKEAGCLDGACPRGLQSYAELPSYLEGNQDYSDCIAVHAEINAIFQFNLIWPYLRDSNFSPAPNMYITDKPCDGCFAALAQAGIAFRYPKG